MARWKSDHRIVPMKPGNAGGGKAVTPPGREPGGPAVLRDGEPASVRRARIRQRARTHRSEPFDNLFAHLDGEQLRDAFEQLETGRAAGVDGISKEEYEHGLEERLIALRDRLHRETYCPLPSRRRWIPKGDGRERPLGIPATEDKVVQRALACVLTEVYEEADAQGPVLGSQPTQPTPQLHVAGVSGLRRPSSTDRATSSGEPEPSTGVLRDWRWGAGCVKGARPVLRGEGMAMVDATARATRLRGQPHQTPGTRRRDPCRARQGQRSHTTPAPATRATRPDEAQGGTRSAS